MIRFLAEVALRIEVSIQATPSNKTSRTIPYPLVQGAYIPVSIYEMDISPPPADSYWSNTWGGTFDLYTGTKIALYYSRFLLNVNNMEELIATPYSLYIDTSDYHVYFNIPKHPWLYSDNSAEGEDLVPFITSALIPEKPSYNIIRKVIAQARLGIPNFTVKLSENISGIILNQDFSLNFHNNDGFFDDDNKWDLFNTPVYLKKAIVENPVYEDFKEIRSGLADSTRTDFDTFSLSVSDKQRGMTDPVCKIIEQEDFQAITIIPEAIGKNIPVVYGTKQIDLIKISNTPETYLAAEYITELLSVFDKDNILLPFKFSGTLIAFNYNAVSGVYDKSNTSIPFSVISDGIQVTTSEESYPQVDYITDSGGNRIPFRYDSSTGVLKYAEAKSAIITGYTPNNIGQIIKDIIGRKTIIQYNASNWNTAEIDAYISIAPLVNIVFTSGDIKKAIQDILKSDMAYFIQQTDGRFTIRKYGEEYGHHEIPSWTITQKPEKDFSKAQSNYFSSCSINYNYKAKEIFDTYFFSELENEAERRYRRIVFKSYDADLVNLSDAKELAKLLSSRYTTMRQSLKLAVGIDTSGYELLDTVSIDMTINGRKFSAASNFIITEINHAQDILTLEETGANDVL